MDFNQIIDRRGTHSSRWDTLESKFGIPMDKGLSMWTADSDYKTAPCVLAAVKKALDHGIFGYYAKPESYKNAIQWWMRTRHNWEVDTDRIVTTQGLGHAIATCIDIFSEPGDHVLIFSPVYLEFRFKIEKANRIVTESPLKRVGDAYYIDFDDAEARMTGKEKLLIWCSPQNPSGRIWTTEELRSVAEFAARHDLIIVSDEIHHDIVYGDNEFVPMDIAAPEHRDRLIIGTSASKTFNIAGMRTGNLIIPDKDLYERVAGRLYQLDYKANILGYHMTEAAYSPEGAEWADAQIVHLEGNRAEFDAGINAIPGVHSLPLASTFLAWVDFSGTGMPFEEFDKRIRERAMIAPSVGPDFGAGGETFMRFNLAAPRARITEAIDRLQSAFSDLQ